MYVKNIQIKWRYLSPNTIFSVSQHLVYKTPYVPTGSISDYTDDIIQTGPLSIPNTTNKLDTMANLDDGSQYFVIPQNQNHSAPKPSDNNNVYYQVLFVSDTK